jgi:hypothetical protein
METPVVEEVRKNNGEYKITFKDPVKSGIDVHLWVKKSDFSPSIIETIKSNSLNAIAKDNYGKSWDELTGNERDNLAVDFNKFPETWGIENEYAGSLCEINASTIAMRRYGSIINDVDNIAVLDEKRGVKTKLDKLSKKKFKVDDYDGLTPSQVQILVTEMDPDLKNDWKDEMNRRNVVTKKNAIKDDAKENMDRLKSTIESDIGTLNTRAVPNCLLIPDISEKSITIKTGQDSGFIEKKLDKVMAKCSALSGEEKKKCFDENISITQNFVKTIDETVYKAIKQSKSPEEVESEKNAVKVLSSIENHARTGNWKDADGKIVDRGPTRNERRDALNAAKLDGKKMLDTSEWKFLAKM